MDRRAFLIASSCAAAGIVAGCTVNQPATQPSGSLPTTVPTMSELQNVLTGLQTADSYAEIALAVACPLLPPQDCAAATAAQAIAVAALNAAQDAIDGDASVSAIQLLIAAAKSAVTDFTTHPATVKAATVAAAQVKPAALPRAAKAK